MARCSCIMRILVSWHTDNRGARSRISSHVDNLLYATKMSRQRFGPFHDACLNPVLRVIQKGSYTRFQSSCHHGVRTDQSRFKALFIRKVFPIAHHFLADLPPRNTAMRGVVTMHNIKMYFKPKLNLWFIDAISSINTHVQAHFTFTFPCLISPRHRSARPDFPDQLTDPTVWSAVLPSHGLRKRRRPRMLLTDRICSLARIFRVGPGSIAWTSRDSCVI